MNHSELKNRLENLIYPNTSRTLGELKLIAEATIHDDVAKIELNTISDDSYLKLSHLIHERFAAEFKQINITKKQAAQKNIHYGHSAHPNNRAPYAKNIIAVTSGKGGVGKTTVAVNLAIALAQEGYKVGILDADVYGPNVPRLTQTDTERISWNQENKIVPSENYGLKIMSVGLTTPKSDTPLVWRSSVAVSALIQLLEDVAWGSLDFMVIDMPPGTGDIQLTMAQELPITTSIIVTTPQMVSTDDVSRAIMMFKDINVPIAGIVENMSFFIAPDTGVQYNIFGNGGGEKIATKYGLSLLGKIPLEMKIREDSDHGRPTVAQDDPVRRDYYKSIMHNVLKQISIQ